MATKTRRRTVTLYNDFHVEFDGTISDGQARRARGALCGSRECWCSGPVGLRGPQDVGVWPTPVEERRGQITRWGITRAYGEEDNTSKRPTDERTALIAARHQLVCAFGIVRSHAFPEHVQNYQRAIMLCDAVLTKIKED